MTELYFEKKIIYSWCFSYERYCIITINCLVCISFLVLPSEMLGYISKSESANRSANEYVIVLNIAEFLLLYVALL